MGHVADEILPGSGQGAQNVAMVAAAVLTDGASAEDEIVAKTVSQIDRAAFRLEREAYWKAEAEANSGSYSAENLARMENGRAPIGSDGYPMELHHIDRTAEGGIEPMTRTDHRLGDNYNKNHP